MQGGSFVWLVIALAGVLGGVGLLAVHISPAEPTPLASVIPLARVLRHRPVRVVLAFLCFLIALIGVSGFIGDVQPPRLP